MVAGYWSPCAPLVWDPVKVPDIRFSSSHFRKQHPRHEKAVIRTSLAEAVYARPSLERVDDSGATADLANQQEMKSGTQQLPENDMGPLAASDKLMDGSPSENLKDADELLLEDIRDQIRYIEKSVMTKEIYYMTRVVRGLSGVRRRLNCNVLRGLMQGYFPNPSPQKTYFLEFLPEAMDTDCPLSSFRPRAGKLNNPLIPEVEVYLHLLLVMFLIDENHLEEVNLPNIS
ncbi:unnamed protein product [Schistosoma curassoni]|uniref:DUF4485 domain-containing protein n=1 Tax=Schistosoma curassoni TaxID=6186 RepID=A0A183L1E9_9TREM|nr:unnamed protein product [Schistosoma curassoni]